MFELKKENCAFLIIDLQGNLFNMMENHDEIVKVTNVMLKTCEVMDIPVLLTEQYRKGLGDTDPAINLDREKILAYEDKKIFTAFTGNIKDAIYGLQKKHVIIIGAETHICVWQTARDLIKNGFVPVILEDGVASRNPKNKENALLSIRNMGGTVLNLETVIFDLLKSADNTCFKEISGMIK